MARGAHGTPGKEFPPVRQPLSRPALRLITYEPGDPDEDLPLTIRCARAAGPDGPDVGQLIARLCAPRADR